MPQRILILGRHGQLAAELKRLAPPTGFEILALGRDQLDLRKTTSISAILRDAAPAAVINAAAFTAVDGAESEPDAAFALNRDAPREIANACAALGAPLIHLSTDYVFDGAKVTPYVETDTTAPLNVYGASKLAGEQAVLASNAKAAIVRTSWVFAAHGANFVRTMSRLAETRSEVRVVDDQIGRPTWARDLAACCFGLAQRALEGDPSTRGLLHFAGADDASWADFAEAIFAETERDVRVHRIATRDYPTPARRPMNSRLSNDKIAGMGFTPRPWREALAQCLRDASEG
jgi:dTDP-4-dehydrorhamnose reductase